MIVDYYTYFSHLRRTLAGTIHTNTHGWFFSFGEDVEDQRGEEREVDGRHGTARRFLLGVSNTWPFALSRHEL